MKVTLKSLGALGASVAMLGLVSMPSVAFADSGSWGDWHQGRSDHRRDCDRDHRSSDRNFRFNLEETNNNDVRVTNDNEQIAITGDATVFSRHGDGEAMSGDATNVNETSTEVVIRNN